MLNKAICADMPSRRGDPHTDTDTDTDSELCLSGDSDSDAPAGACAVAKNASIPGERRVLKDLGPLQRSITTL